MMGAVYWIRVFNAVLAGIVVGLCFMRVSFSVSDRPRSARIFGLGLLCIAISWLSIARRHESYKPWIPLITIGLLCCFYGMRRSAAGEVTERGNVK